MNELNEIINNFYDSYWYAYKNEMPIWKDEVDRDKTMLWHFYKYINEKEISKTRTEIEEHGEKCRKIFEEIIKRYKIETYHFDFDTLTIPIPNKGKKAIKDSK